MMGFVGEKVLFTCNFADAEGTMEPRRCKRENATRKGPVHKLGGERKIFPGAPPLPWLI